MNIKAGAWLRLSRFEKELLLRNKMRRELNAAPADHSN